MNLIKKSFAAIFGLGLLMVSLNAAPSSTDSNQSFAFKFEAGKPLVYLVDVKTSATTTVDAGSQGAKPVTTMSTEELRSKFKLTPVKNSRAGVMTVYYKPFDIKGDVDIMNSSGHFVTSLRDMQVKGTQNGILLFDSAKDIGMAQAKKFRNEMLTVFLSGYMDFDGQGNVREFRGDLPFVDYWNDTLKNKIGFFGIIFPGRAVAVDDSWQKSLALKTVGVVKLDGDGLVYTNTFIRDPDTTVDGKPLATFTMTAPLDDQNLTGYFEQPGQNTSMEISQFNRDANGTFHFDQSQGVLVDNKTRATVGFVMNSLFQGRSTTVRTDMQMDMQINLLDDSAPDSQP